MPDLEQARDLVKAGDYEMLSVLYDNVPEVLAQLVRTAFIPAPGYKFIVADFSAIEARVVAHLAGEKWVSDTFKEGGDIYCETASRMFGVPVEKHGQNGELRQKGKQAVLSCSYGGSVGALRAMGAIEAGMKEEELQPLVDASVIVMVHFHGDDRVALGTFYIDEPVRICAHVEQALFTAGAFYSDGLCLLLRDRHLSFIPSLSYPIRAPVIVIRVW